METAASEAVYRFEGFVLDLTRGALLNAQGREVPLRAKSFELLCLLVTNAGRLLDRDAINKAIWADVIVTDDSIAQCVRDIRRALGDGTFGGSYQRPDDEMQSLWEVAVAEVRDLLDSW